MSELRVKLEGETATLGEVAAGDVARLILGVEHAIAQAASVVLGRPKTTPGRYEDAVERASRLKLLAIEAGSVVPVFELPDAVPVDGMLDLDVSSLGETALDALLAAADPQQHSHPLVAKALLELADTMRLGERYQAVSFDSPTRHGGRREVSVDGEVRARLRSYVDSMPVLTSRPDAVGGVLVEADFESRTARLRTVSGAVRVTFDESLDDDIQTALREATTLRGEVVYDPRTHTAKSVVLHAVERGEQLLLGLESAAFWRERSFVELAREQGAGRPVDPAVLVDADASDAERDAFMAAIEARA